MTRQGAHAHAASMTDAQQKAMASDERRQQLVIAHLVRPERKRVRNHARSLIEQLNPNPQGLELGTTRKEFVWARRQ